MNIQKFTQKSLEAVNMLENSYRQPKGKAVSNTLSEEFERR